MGEVFRAGANVVGTSGELGTLEAVIIDPTAQVVTDLVVAHDRLGPRALVPLRAVTGSTAEDVTLDLDAAGLAACPAFDISAVNQPGSDFTPDDYFMDPGVYYLEPFATPMDSWPLGSHERIPKGECSIRRGDEVETSDGTKAGHVDEFLVDPADGHITHVVLRQGHLLGHHDDCVIPVAHATEISEGKIRLDIDISQVAALDHIPVKRHGHVAADG
jgi:sporulation protein YlmC with PRC-barrel domain